MFKTRILGALSGLALVAGCGGDVQAPAQDEALRQGDMSYEEFLSLVYQEPDSGIFIANGDEPFEDEKLLREYYENHIRGGQLIVHRSGGADAKWSDTQKLNLTYCVSTTFGTNYTRTVNAMAAAAAAWEAVSNINFIHKSAQDSNCTASNTNVLFDVRPVNSGGQYLARAFFPGYSRSSRNVLIDNSAYGSLGAWTLEGILRHELGHVLGFRHEHTRPEAGTCFEDTSWRALTTYDSYSVMHYPQCNGKQTGDLVITSKDAQGSAALYGAPGSGGGGGSGTPVSTTINDSVAQGAQDNFGPYSVVAGTTFKVVMTGSGDPDLYVRFGSAPTTSTYNCRPYLSGASETCNLTVPAGITSAYIMVRGYTAATYSLAINYTRP